MTNQDHAPVPFSRRPTLPVGPRATPARMKVDAMTAVRDARILAKSIDVFNAVQNSIVKSFNAAVGGGDAGIAAWGLRPEVQGELAVFANLISKIMPYGYQKLGPLPYIGDAPTVQVENKMQFVLKIGDDRPTTTLLPDPRAAARAEALRSGNGAGGADATGDDHQSHDG